MDSIKNVVKAAVGFVKYWFARTAIILVDLAAPVLGRMFSSKVTSANMPLTWKNIGTFVFAVFAYVALIFSACFLAGKIMVVMVIVLASIMPPYLAVFFAWSVLVCLIMSFVNDDDSFVRATNDHNLNTSVNLKFTKRDSTAEPTAA